jgi:hypothetical protein
MLLIQHAIDAEPVVTHACTNCKDVNIRSTPPLCLQVDQQLAHC